MEQEKRNQQAAVKRWMLCVMMGLTLIVTACRSENPPPEQETPDPGTGMELENETMSWMTFDEWLFTLPAEERNLSGMTGEQYLNDFDYLYRVLKENYPYFGVARRKADMDLDKRYVEARAKAAVCTDDLAFMQLIQAEFLPDPQIGHLMLIPPDWYFALLDDSRNTIRDYPEYADQERPYLEALEYEPSLAFYENLQKFYDDQQAAYEQWCRENGYENEDADQNEADVQDRANVRTEILEEGSIAYAYVRSLNMNTYEEDREILFDFYETVADYEHLIFDFSENSGGGMGYFINLILQPNMDEVLGTQVYLFYKDGENNRRFLRETDFDSLESVDSLPELPELNLDDLNTLDYYRVIESFPWQVEPEYEEKMFQGTIWMLVSEKVYSSAEYAAAFSKKTGFARLVGSTTGGDGIGTTPVYITMPGTGLMVRYSPVYGTTADGRSSEEFGTEPDYASRAGETPLETCLRVIQERSDE